VNIVSVDTLWYFSIFICHQWYKHGGRLYSKWKQPYRHSV